MDLTIEHKDRTLMGSDTITVTAGQTLKIETTPGGQEVLLEEVPEGKLWSAKINVEIVETDA